MAVQAVSDRKSGRATKVRQPDVLFRRCVTGVVIALALLWLVPVAWALDTSVKAEPDTIKIPASWAIPHFTLVGVLAGVLGQRHRPLVHQLGDRGGRGHRAHRDLREHRRLCAVAPAHSAARASSTRAILAGIMIPPQALMVPLFREFQAIHLINTYWALILPRSRRRSRCSSSRSSSTGSRSSSIRRRGSTARAGGRATGESRCRWRARPWRRCRSSPSCGRGTTSCGRSWPRPTRR